MRHQASCPQPVNTKKHDVPEELLASLLADYKKPEDLIGENGLLKATDQAAGRARPGR